MDRPPLLLAVPNVSEGRDEAALEAIAGAFTGAGARLLGATHRDPDHGRAVLTLAARPRVLADALVAGAREAVARIDLRRHAGVHPHVGALDVAPVVFLDGERRGAACAEALVVADRLGAELGLPVLLYGALAGGRSRAELRRGGRGELARRGAAGDLRPDFGPPALHPSAGATLVGARAPLVAFNLELAAPAGVAQARAAAAAVREGGADGLPGVRALGLMLAARGGVAQVSCNVEDHRAVPLARLLEAVERHAPVAEAELVGLAPRAAFDGWPQRVPIRNRATVEDALDAGRDAPRSGAGEAGGRGRPDAGRPAQDAGRDAPRS
jgi:glutamate formiminotransferase/glutamate formiminotransferase/formiminotetrahydrofolate cyclodeaminase